MSETVGKAVGDNMTQAIQPGMRGEYVEHVGPHVPLADFGPDVPRVLSSPWMLWCMEHAARACVAACLPPGHDTVGVGFDFRHLAPAPEGSTVTATAEVIAVEGREVTFAIEAHDGTELVGQGTHVRAVIDVERFAKRVRRKVDGER